MAGDVLSVVCVQVGNYLGRGPEYVGKLRRSIQRYLTLAHRFYVVTDDAASNYPGMRCKPASPLLRGWWQKLRLFKPGMFPEGRVIFIDLDTLILGNIDALASYDGEFAILEDFYRRGGYGSGVMLWRSGFGARIWEAYEAAGFPQGDTGGDQAFLERTAPRAEFLQKRFPGVFESYKVHAREGAHGPVVCFHGQPRPHEVGGWAGAAWNAL
jgi:hypothetical protein